MIGDAAVVLQAVALSLPAVALYMTVLTELHNDVVRAQGLSPDPDSPAYEGPGPVQGKIEHIHHHGFLTLTIAEDAWDFRLAAISLAGLVLAAIVLVVSVVLRVEQVYWVGAGLTVVALGILTAALAWTVYASLNQLYPGG